MNKAALSLWLATVALAPLAGAQTPSPSPGTPATAAAPAGSAAPAVGEPVLPNIDDAMLAPAPAPQHVLQSWREALGLVRSRSTPLRTSLAQIDIAKARSRQVLAASLPNLTSMATSDYIRYELLRNDVPTGFGTTVSMPRPEVAWGAGAGLRVPVFAPKAWYDRGTAEQAVDYAKLSTKEVERQVIAGVADTIVGAVVAERASDVTRESLRSALSTLDLNRRRSALGASSALDVLRMEQEVQAARAQVVTADEVLMRARESLGLALGSAEGWGVNTDVRLDALAEDAQKTCRVETDIAKRSDVRAATANVGVVDRQKGSVDWAFWPTVDAVSLFQYQRQDFITNLNFSWTVGATLNWVLYDGGLRYGQKDEAGANGRVAREQLADTRRRAELEVTQAFRAVRVAETQLTVSVKARDIAHETARLQRVAYMNGSGTSFELVDTESRLRQAELDLVLRQFALLRAKVAALLALASCDI